MKSEYATIRIPEIDLEIPPQTQKGSINTIEGFIQRTIMGISELQEERRRYNPQIAAQIDDFLAKAKEYADGKVLPFTFVLIDPSGNSFVQNPDAPKLDPNLKETKFIRSTDDYVKMGYQAEQAELMVMEDEVNAEASKEEIKP